MNITAKRAGVSWTQHAGIRARNMLSTADEDVGSNEEQLERDLGTGFDHVFVVWVRHCVDLKKSWKELYPEELADIEGVPDDAVDDMMVMIDDALYE